VTDLAVLAGADTVAAAREVLAQNAKSFRFAGLFLPRARLDDAAIVYAFCRLVDDAIDEADSRAAAQAEAVALRDEIDGARPPRPVVRAFLAVAARLNMDLGFARGLIDGVAFDANERVRVADDDGLLRYCYLVAGTVGGMMCAVLGVRDPAAVRHAIDLGVGMQLTNISRDVREDGGRDRVYIPASRLRAHGVADPDALPSAIAGPAPPRDAVAAVVRELLDLAERYYASADDGMRAIPFRSRFAIVIASRVYRAIGRKLLRRRRGDALAGRVSTTTIEKLFELIAGIAHFVRVTVSRPAPHDASLHVALRGLPGCAGSDAAS